MNQKATRAKRCYAASLGDCAGPISLEHYLSSGILKRLTAPLIVEGLASHQAPVARSIKAMGSKILCKHHNEALSELDDEAALLFDCLRAFHNRERIADKTIDGGKIEKWMIKFLVGYIVSGNAKKTDGVTTKSAEVPDEWLRLIFGLDKFREKSGLIFFQVPATEISINPIECTPNTDVQTGSLYGVRIALCGFNFHTGIRPVNWKRLELCVFRPSGLIFPGLGWKLIFQWEYGEPGGFVSIHNDPGM